MKNIFWKLAVAVLVLLARAPLRAAETNAPMPMDKLILRVLERAQKEDDNDNRFKSRYCFTRSKSQETRNGKGDLKKREAGTGTNDPAVFALQLAAKKKTQKKSLTINGGRATESDSSVQGRAFEPGDFPMGQDLMGRFDFKVVARQGSGSSTGLVQIDVALALFGHRGIAGGDQHRPSQP